MTDVVIAAFYHFAPLDDYQELRNPLKDFCNSMGLKGTILLAKEGVNSTISGSREAIDALMARLKSDPRLADLEWKESYATTQPFAKMKVRLKQEIVRLAVDGLDAARERGEYVTSEEWDQFISAPETLVIDTRNEYEIKIGTFEGAINPNTQNFRDFPAWLDGWIKEVGEEVKQRPVAMFCTGGIRCEKSTAFLRQQGFEKVMHLKGGILQYLEDTGNKNGKWQGECFVFDDRVAVDDQLHPSQRIICRCCGTVVTTDDLKLGPKGKVLCKTCTQDDDNARKQKQICNTTVS